MSNKIELNPDEIIHEASQAKLKMYEAKESFDAIAKESNDYINLLIRVIKVMKERILELESQLKEKK